MARVFDIPSFYRSDIATNLKTDRREADPRKLDISPSIVKKGNVTFKIARHFGFCFGVENAIETAFKAINENPNKRLFLLSEMIHNPKVNQDLKSRNVQFLRTPEGKEIIPFSELTPNDIVIIPAFGTTRELVLEIKNLGIDPTLYDATCPFVEKVWNRSKQLGEKGFSVIIHGKYYHEETKATFSHAMSAAPSVIVRNMEEAKMLSYFINGEKPFEEFYNLFAGKFSVDFNPSKHLSKVGVVNQTTMLANETREISQYFKDVMTKKYGEDEIKNHFADTKDTLCYATQENQEAVQELVKTGGDVAIVVGGYNSSNTTHLAAICRRYLPTFHIDSAEEIINSENIYALSTATNERELFANWLPIKNNIEVLITAGASSPDSVVDEVIARITHVVA